MFRTLHRAFHSLAWLMAVLGGAVLTAVILMICLSILGRTASTILHSALVQGAVPGLAVWLLDHGVGPIRGDYELVEAGIAFVIFAFLGWCQITAGHATVDIFTSRLRERSRRWLQLAIEAAFAVALVVIALQLWEGMATLMRRNMTTFLLQYPVWWNYALAVAPAFLAAAIGLYMAAVRAAEAVLNRPLIADPHGIDP